LLSSRVKDASEELEICQVQSPIGQWADILLLFLDPGHHQVPAPGVLYPRYFGETFGGQGVIPNQLAFHVIADVSEYLHSILDNRITPVI